MLVSLGEFKTLSSFVVLGGSKRRILRNLDVKSQLIERNSFGLCFLSQRLRQTFQSLHIERLDRYHSQIYDGLYNGRFGVMKFCRHEKSLIAE